MREDGVDLVWLASLPFTSVMVKVLTRAALPACSFLTPDLLSFVTATSATAVVKLWPWPPRLTPVSPPPSVFRTELREAAAGCCLCAAASLSRARPLGSSGGGAIGERAAGSVGGRGAVGFLSTQDLVGAHEAAFSVSARVCFMAAQMQRTYTARRFRGQPTSECNYRLAKVSNIMR